MKLKIHRHCKFWRVPARLIWNKGSFVKEFRNEKCENR